MKSDHYDRWKEPESSNSDGMNSPYSKHSRLAAISSVALIVSLEIFSGHRLEFSKDNADRTAEELRLSLDDLTERANFELDETVAKLVTRVNTLESENQRLDAELDELTRSGGVIDRIVAHVRSLHAQTEATRRDVVGALTVSTPDGDQTSIGEGVDLATPAEGQEPSFSTKARHTIVTPVAVEAPADVAAPTFERRKDKPRPIEPSLGTSN